MTDSREPRSRATRWVILVAAILASWIVGAFIVKIGLGWADSFDYTLASEDRYLAVAALALAVSCTGTVASVVLFARTRRQFALRRVVVSVIIVGVCAALAFIALWKIV